MRRGTPIGEWLVTLNRCTRYEKVCGHPPPRLAKPATNVRPSGENASRDTPAVGAGTDIDPTAWLVVGSTNQMRELPPAATATNDPCGWNATAVSPLNEQAALSGSRGRVNPPTLRRVRVSKKMTSP